MTDYSTWLDDPATSPVVRHDTWSRFQSVRQVWLPHNDMTAGDVLACLENLRQANTFTREQVAYLIDLAYRSGAQARTRFDVAEIEGMADEFPPDARLTRRERVMARMAEMEEAAARVRHGYPPRKYWPAAMPGGWPIPPEIPSDKPADWWPEHDGWPCPPPHLRGLAG